ncbi:MAG: hypothetical protein L3J07_03865 [Candidatus Magasanikbacteria bacterium]|nr:hypothetical protein [Candidatus Magasanikbacteria bacterium]
MNNFNSQHTLNLLELFYNDLPPMVPVEVEDRMGQVLKSARKNEADLQELEQIAIFFGRYLWPFWRSFYDLIGEHHKNLGEGFFVDKLENNLKSKYRDYKHSGKTFSDIKKGRGIEDFSYEERRLLNEFLVEVGGDIKKFTKQSIYSTSDKKYRKNIEKYRKILKEVDKTLEKLRKMAEENEKDCPSLSEEIISKVQYFENSLCRFAPELDYREVFGAEEHFCNRKKEKQIFNR